MADARKGELRCRARGDTKQGESEEAPDAVSSLSVPCPASAPRTLEIQITLPRYLGGLVDYCRYNADAQSTLALDPWSVKHGQVATCQRSSRANGSPRLVLSISTVCSVGSGSMPGYRGGRAGRGETLGARGREKWERRAFASTHKRGEARMNNRGFGHRKQAISIDCRDICPLTQYGLQ